MGTAKPEPLPDRVVAAMTQLRANLNSGSGWCVAHSYSRAELAAAIAQKLIYERMRSERARAAAYPALRFEYRLSARGAAYLTERIDPRDRAVALDRINDAARRVLVDAFPSRPV